MALFGIMIAFVNFVYEHIDMVSFVDYLKNPIKHPVFMLDQFVYATVFFTYILSKCIYKLCKQHITSLTCGKDYSKIYVL